MKTIKKIDNCVEVSIAKYLSGYAKDKTKEFTADFEIYIKQYQKANGLTNDGIIGTNTWKTFIKTAPVVSTVKNRKSDHTYAIQLILGIDADGIFGSKTKNAVKIRQKEAEITEDGIVGQKTWQYLILGTVKKHNEYAIQPVNYKQYDNRWGKKTYSSHNDKSQTYASSACGPTAAADIVATWWDSTVTPVTMGELAIAGGYRTYSSGTSGSFFKKVAEKYCAIKYVVTSNIETAIQCLDDNGYVVVCFGPGSKKKWTKGGHYCVLWKYDGTYFYVNDPASSSSSRAKGTYAEVKDARKNFYCFWK